ncbi:MAG: alpha/beta hydrolase [Pseudomonadota bacterium]
MGWGLDIPPPSGAFVTVDGAKVHYVRKGSGPALVLIHGASGNLRDWTFQHVDRLAEQYDVIAIDRPGHGHSDRVPRGDDPRVQARHMQKALAALGVERAVVAGHSFGGTVALAWAVTLPETVSGLCLIAAPSHRWEGSVAKIYVLTDHWLLGPLIAFLYPLVASDRLIRDTLDRVFAPGSAPDGYADHIHPNLALRYNSVRWNAADVARLKPRVVEMTQHYPALTMPIEMIHGTGDETVPFDIHTARLIDAVPNGTLTKLEGVGHMPHHTRAAEVFAALDRLRATAG